MTARPTLLLCFIKFMPLRQPEVAKKWQFPVFQNLFIFCGQNIKKVDRPLEITAKAIFLVYMTNIYTSNNREKVEIAHFRFWELKISLSLHDTINCTQLVGCTCLKLIAKKFMSARSKSIWRIKILPIGEIVGRPFVIILVLRNEILPIGEIVGRSIIDHFITLIHQEQQQTEMNSARS